MPGLDQKVRETFGIYLTYR